MLPQLSSPVPGEQSKPREQRELEEGAVVGHGHLAHARFQESLWDLAPAAR